ncbi:MAG: hypothetical protein RBR86_03820 [Pseudobdellovibrionaceae bacterium]|jgi:probable HAF family extracellular repeat protein|nr:hypothetical protein [Pseudobdellovibrionaceae bacterium]
MCCSRNLTLFITFTILPFHMVQAQSLENIGDLAGGTFDSYAYDINANGNVIVGQGASASGTEAFRWVNGVGMTGLGDLSGGAFFSEAISVSADGNVVVG